MGGVVDIREGVSWLPQGWVYRDVQENLADVIEEQDGQLSILLRQSTIGIDYCSLINLEAKRLQMILFCLERFYTNPPPNGFNLPKQPSNFKLYLLEVTLFKALLRTDPRSGEDLSRTGCILLKSDALWTAPLWAYDFVLEQWATALRLSHSDLADWLLTARSSQGQDECDLREIQGEPFRLALSHADYMTQRYSGNFEAVADELFAELGPRLQTLKELMQGDPRAQETV